MTAASLHCWPSISTGDEQYSVLRLIIATLSIRPGSGEAASRCMLHAKLWSQSVHQPLAGLQFVERCAAVLPGEARWAVHGARLDRRVLAALAPPGAASLWSALLCWALR